MADPAEAQSTPARLPERDRAWMMRTYSGHSTATASNELYRTNLAQGQTGLSIAFDLPTQTGYDPDHPSLTARSARSVSRSRTWATYARCSPASHPRR
ncbi:MAG: methylmalonyl-CoA mutase family protein [Microthrixaceae bacterium]|nr:methylmalonyl-CoA mutase family protein [Microthrixaceae bacterium]